MKELLWAFLGALVPGLAWIGVEMSRKKKGNPIPHVEAPVVPKFDFEKIRSAFIDEARRWVGVKEVGHNGGPEIEKFQRAVDGKAEHEPWCAAFVCYCIKAIETGFNVKSPVHKSEHCLTLYGNTPKELHLDSPEPGCLVVWRKGETSNGHVGIVTSVLGGGEFKTIEGNSGRPDDVVERSGDGVWEHRRSVSGSGDMQVWGFVRVFPEK